MAAFPNQAEGSWEGEEGPPRGSRPTPSASLGLGQSSRLGGFGALLAETRGTERHASLEEAARGSASLRPPTGGSPGIPLRAFLESPSLDDGQQRL